MSKIQENQLSNRTWIQSMGSARRSTRVAVALALLLLGYLVTAENSGYLPTDASSREARGETSVQQDETQLADTRNDEETEEPPLVRILESEARDTQRTIRLTGQVAPNRQVLVRTETTGKITEVLVEVGKFVKKGDMLAKIEVGSRKAQQMRAQALADLRKIELESSEKLAKQGLESEVRRASARANFEEARAGLIQIDDEIEDLSIRAPFSGVIADKMVEIGAFVRTSDPIASIVELNPAMVKVSIAETEIHKVTVGDTVVIRVDTIEVNDAVLERISPVADPTTRTFSTEIRASNSERKLLSGMTAAVTIKLRPEPTHRVPASAVTLSIDGILGVKAVDDSMHVVFYPIDLRQDSTDGVELAGNLPSNLRVIVVGQSDAVIGETVRIE